MASKYQRKRRFKSEPINSTRIQKMEEPKLDDLPNEVLTEICSRVRVGPKRNIIRSVSSRILELDNKHMLIEFKKAVCQAASNPAAEENIAILVIHWATEAYLELGLASTFCESFLAMLQSHSNDSLPFAIDRRQMYVVLQHFFHAVDRNWPHSQQLQDLALNATVCRLLGKFENSNVRWIASETFYARFEVELTGVYLGWVPPQPIPRGISQTPYSLIVMVAELLLGHKTCMAFDQLREGSWFEVFMYGNSLQARRRVLPKTSFTIGLFGARDVAEFLKSCLEEPNGEFLRLAQMPKYQFTLSYRITSQKAVQKGCERVLGFLSGEVCSAREPGDLNCTDMALP